MDGNLRLSCHYLDSFIVCGYHEGAFHGRAGRDIGGTSLKSCCSDYGKNSVQAIPIVDGDLEKAFAAFIELRDDTIARLNNNEPTACDGCPELKFIDASDKMRFSYVIFNEMGICNCKCCYCNHQERLGRNVSGDVDFVHLMQLVRDYGFDDSEGIVELCNGEITVNPNKKKIYESIADCRIMFITNGLVFDDFIKTKLENGGGIINLSIDCGTRKTFAKVKGMDAFDKVVNNLKRYSDAGKGILNLKYILLPGINDNRRDIKGFVELCSILNVASAHISHDLRLSYSDYDNKRTASALRLLLGMLKRKSIKFEVYSVNILNEIIRKRFLDAAANPGILSRLRKICINILCGFIPMRETRHKVRNFWRRRAWK